MTGHDRQGVHVQHYLRHYFTLLVLGLGVGVSYLLVWVTPGSPYHSKPQVMHSVEQPQLLDH